MHASRLVPPSTVAWLRGMALVTALFNTAGLPVFAAEADLGLDPQILPTVTFPGLPAEFVIEVANFGPDPAGMVAVGFGIPELRMVSFVSAASSQGRCSTALDTCAGSLCQEVPEQLLAVSCDLGALAADGTATLRVTASIDLPENTHLTVSADVESEDTADANPANDSIAVQVPVNELPGAGVQGGAGPGGCFLQTLTFGTPWAEDVHRSGRFRDLR